MKTEIQNFFKLSDDQVEKLDQYAALLIKWNRTHNLTTITEPNKIWLNHFADSLQPILLIPNLGRLIDLGTGAGLPGIPIALLRPNVEVVLVEARQKKVAFCEAVVRELNLKNVVVKWGRAEECSEFWNQCDVVTSRATWNLADFMQHGMSYKATDGVLIAYKGKNYQTELTEAAPTVQKLGLTDQVIPGHSFRADSTPTFLIILK